MAEILACRSHGWWEETLLECSTVVSVSWGMLAGTVMKCEGHRRACAFF